MDTFEITAYPLLVREVGEGIVWPYTLRQLRLDEPQLSLPLAPRDVDLEALAALEPSIVIAIPQPTIPPAHDERTEKPREITPSKNASGRFVQSWEIRQLTEQEIREEYEKNHAPKWDDFAALLMQEPRVKLFLKEVVSLDPGVFGGFIGGLAQASSNGPGFFVFTWQKVSAQGLIPPELREFVIEAAEQSDLPADFLQVL